MGQMLVKLAEADPELEISAKVDVASGYDAAWPAGTEAIIDFTFHAAVPANIEKAAAEGAAYVIGTTGLTPEEQARVDACAAKIPVVQAANYSLGVNLLIDLVRQGKALYVGISKYPPELQQSCYDILKEARVPCLLSQYRCSMFDPKAKNHNFQIAADNGSGIICFSPLAQGLLTGKYDNGIPEGSRAAKSTGFLQQSQVTPARVEAVKKLALMAEERGQSIAQMALAWVLADERVTSCIIGTSSVMQLENNLQTLDNLSFSEEEMKQIDSIINQEKLWF